MNREIQRQRIKSAYYINRDRLRQARNLSIITRQPLFLHKRPRSSKFLIQKPSLNKNLFRFQQVIGKGGFGRVWKVQQKNSKKAFAMKEMSKIRVVSKRSVNSVMNQRKLLASMRHPFIVNIQFAFQDRENLYLVMDLMTGGDLRYHIGRHRSFSQQATRFMVACIIQGLQYIHTQKVIHRDIKPENLVLDQKGYVKITDFGVARALVPDNAKDTSGTPGYMAPQVICRQNHGIAVDYFALGVLTYEFMMGRRPYLGRNRKEIRDQILSKQVQIRKHEVPQGWSLQAADFINSLIQRKPAYRIGFRGPQEVKQHQWMRNFPWEELKAGVLEAPFKPDAFDNFDQRVTMDWSDEIDPSITVDVVEKLFNGYVFSRKQSQKSTCPSEVGSLI